MAVLMLVSLLVVLAGCGGGTTTLGDGIWVGEAVLSRSHMGPGNTPANTFEARGDRIHTANRVVNVEYARLILRDNEFELALPGIQNERVIYSFERINANEVLIDGIRFRRQQ